MAGVVVEGERKSQAQADSPVSIEPDKGLNLMTLRSLPEPKSQVRRLAN